jgi:asparagine synthase (glutamine-hydrolysing)
MKATNIRCSSDEEYDEQFLALFRQAVERRTGPGAPILAELSGGMDSSSIVCMSDHLRRSGDASADILETISFYDDSEPSWNERPYFTTVEAKRGKSGIHLRTSFLDRTAEMHDPSLGTYFLPGADRATIDREQVIQEAIGDRAYKSIVSGIGGDEVLGGIPTPMPELADYLISGHLKLLLGRSVDWCLVNRTPLSQMLLDTLQYAIDVYRPPRIEGMSMPPWLRTRLQRICANLKREDVTGSRGPDLTPSGISTGLAWWWIMETLPHAYPGILARPDYLYPYLDKQLVDFLFCIPREQLVRPGRRRSLMRRALKNIVPEEILERRRKAYRTRGPLLAMQHDQSKIHQLFADAWICNQGFVDSAKFLAALDRTSSGVDTRWWQSLSRAIALELWVKETGPSQVRTRPTVSPQQVLLSRMGANKIRTVRAAN